MPAAPTGSPAIQQLLQYARTSQDCGSSTAHGPEKTEASSRRKKIEAMRRFVDNGR
jgi:hypothetical protein